MKNKLLLIVCVALATSCNTLRTVHLLKKGGIRQTSFCEAIPFDYNRLIWIKVWINGKYYTFIFDTGAGVSLISDELAQTLRLSPRSTAHISDSQGGKGKLEFYLIDSLKIGDLTFTDQPFASADFSKLSCAGRDLDGIIGSNLMSKAIWYIDNATNTITITDNRDRLELPPNGYKFDFTTRTNGLLPCKNPYVIVSIDSFLKSKPVELDMGSAYGFDIDRKSIEPNMIFEHYSFGNGAVGLMGHGAIDTTFFSTASNIDMQGLHINSEQLIAIGHSGISMIGMPFLRNYNVLIDWPAKEVVMSANTVPKKEKISSLGFRCDIIDNKCIVDEVYHNSGSEKEGVRIGDQVLKVDDLDFQTDADKCELLKKMNNISSKQVSMEILKADNTHLKISVSNNFEL